MIIENTTGINHDYYITMNIGLAITYDGPSLSAAFNNYKPPLSGNNSCGAKVHSSSILSCTQPSRLDCAYFTKSTAIGSVLPEAAAKVSEQLAIRKQLGLCQNLKSMEKTWKNHTSELYAA